MHSVVRSLNYPSCLQSSGLFHLDNLVRSVISLVGVQLSQTKAVLRTRAGQRAVLECDPQGDQPITVTWTRHGAPITREQQKYFKVNKLKQTTKYFFINSCSTIYTALHCSVFSKDSLKIRNRYRIENIEILIHYIFKGFQT